MTSSDLSLDLATRLIARDSGRARHVALAAARAAREAGDLPRARLTTTVAMRIADLDQRGRLIDLRV